MGTVTGPKHTAGHWSNRPWDPESKARTEGEVRAWPSSTPHPGHRAGLHFLRLAGPGNRPWPMSGDQRASPQNALLPLPHSLARVQKVLSAQNKDDNDKGSIPSPSGDRCTAQMRNML